MAMSDVRVSWANAEQTIFLFEFPLEWKWEAFRVAQAVSTEMLDSRAHQLQVGIVWTMPKMGKLPMGNFAAGLQALSTRDSRIAKIVLVTENGLVQIMWQTLIGLYTDAAKNFGIENCIDAAMYTVKTRLAELNHEMA
jgi:hypothetical protein